MWFSFFVSFLSPIVSPRIASAGFFLRDSASAAGNQ